jgi:hypothetical protein
MTLIAARRAIAFISRVRWRGFFHRRLDLARTLCGCDPFAASPSRRIPVQTAEPVFRVSERLITEY